MLEITLGKDACYDIASDSLGRKTAPVRQALLGANPALKAFELSRTGDDITLSFGFGAGTERTDFRLRGSKHDFYRLAMGVRLEETMAILAKGDPNIEAAGAEAAEEGIVLRVAYARPGGHVPAYALPPEPKPVPEPPPMPAPPAVVEKPPSAALEPHPEPVRNPKYLVPARELAPLGSRPATQNPSSVPPPPPTPAPAPPTPSRAPPGAAEAPVAVAAPRPPPLSQAPVVRETTATAAPAAREPALAAPRNRAEVDFRAASQAGTLKAWTRFLELHPDSPFSAEAGDKANQLREQAAYAHARERDDAAGYRGFLENFPNSSLRGEVEVRFKALEESRRVAEVERRHLAMQAKRLRAAYDQTRKLDSPEAYRVFLAAHPASEEAVEARQRLQAIEDDEEAYQASRGSASRLEGYLALYPEGRHADEARQELQSILALEGRRSPAPDLRQ